MITYIYIEFILYSQGFILRRDTIFSIEKKRLTKIAKRYMVREFLLAYLFFHIYMSRRKEVVPNFKLLPIFAKYLIADI